jgi:hypothetical protein
MHEWDAPRGPEDALTSTFRWPTGSAQANAKAARAETGSHSIIHSYFT